MNSQHQTMIKNSVFLLFLCTFLAFQSFSQKNTIVLVAEYRTDGRCSTDSALYNIIYKVREDILKLDIHGPQSNSSIIYQPSTEMLWVLYHYETLYYSMNKEHVTMLENEIKVKSDEFEATYEAMDEASKEQTKMLWPAGNPFKFEKPEYNLVNKKDSLVSQLLCDKYSAEISNGNMQHIFFNNLKSMDIKSDELKVLESFNQFLGNGVKAISGNMDFSAIRFRDEGLPILFENFYGKNLCNQYWVKQIFRAKFDNQEFEIPVHYGKYENPLGIK